MSPEPKATILIVDDTPANLKYLREVLYGSKYDVRVAPNGRLGLQAALSDPPDLVLLDIMMPDMNGYDVCTQLKAEEATKDIPIIFLSALDETWDKVKAFELGAVDYVTKPFEPIELLQRIKAQIQLRKAQQQLTDLNATLHEQIGIINRYIPNLVTDTHGHITHVSDAYCRLSGYSKDELLGKDCCDYTYDSDPLKNTYAGIRKALNQGQPWEGEIQSRKKDGGHFWVHVNASPQYGEDGTITAHSYIQQDITDQKRVEQLSITDELTGLYNRRKFNTDFPLELNRARRDSKNVALLMLDVDHFKLYNDTYGHLEGDKILRIIGQTLKQTFLRAGDHTFRLGGEEFGIILSSLHTTEFSAMAERIRANIEALGIPHTHSTTAPVVTISIGMMVVPHGNTKSPTDIYRITDEALYQAKETGRNQVKIIGG